jgi:hypothetical protein
MDLGKGRHILTPGEARWLAAELVLAARDAEKEAAREESL